MIDNKKTRLRLVKVGLMDKGYYLKNTASPREMLYRDGLAMKALRYKKNC